MICPKCHTPLELPANFCPNCGVGLQRSGGRILAVTAALVLAVVIGVYGYLNHRFSDGRDSTSPTAARSFQDDDALLRPDDPQKGAMATDRSSIDPLTVNRADLILTDITGRELGTYAVTIMSSGWFAFPKQFCIGGFTWQVALDNQSPLPVEGAILRDEDPVGLWQVSENTPLGGLELAPWTADRPLHWYSLDDEYASRGVLVHAVEKLGNFVQIPLGPEIAGPGLFIQDGKVVGWSFGEWIPGGYLWTGNQGFELIPEFYTDDFYRLTFAGGREEAFLLALADQNLSDFQLLAALTEAHHLGERMPPDLAPAPVRPTAIHDTMRRLVQELRSRGRIEDLLTLFDPPTLLAVDHPPLVADLVTAAQDAGQYAHALILVDTLAQAAAGRAEDDRDPEALQAALYRTWLDRLVAEGDWQTAREIYQQASDRFPQDPAIHLVGVELLLQHNWALAERRLAARNYPGELRDRVSRLQQAISELKSLEGKIVIRFRPGSRTIPVTAGLDGAIAQRFLIDTGASIVTVPTTAVQRLGIDLSSSLPRRLFYSATGVQNAVEVTLPAVEINGWVIENVKALVVDLPGKPGVGLLGMNYLSHFRMDLNTEEGLLVLAPR